MLDIGIKIAIGDCLSCEAQESECANEAVTQGEKSLAIGRHNAPSVRANLNR
jgi:hypothetical protein